MQPVDHHTIEYTSVVPNTDIVKWAYDLFVAITGGSPDGALHVLSTIWSVYSVIAFILSGLFIYGIIYSYILINQFSEMKALKMAAEEERWRQLHNPDQGNRRWEEVQQHVLSNNPNDWKLAIIEADVMLEKMLEDAGFAGVTIADRLRSASGRSFATIEDAWQAHRVRNLIAHGGSDFVLTQKMAQSTIVQYQKVFQEFNII